MKRLLIGIALGVLGLLLLNCLVASCLLIVELVSHFGIFPQEPVTLYFHYTGYSMFALVGFLFWKGPAIRRYLEKEADLRSLKHR